MPETTDQAKPPEGTVTTEQEKPPEGPVTKEQEKSHEAPVGSEKKIVPTTLADVSEKKDESKKKEEPQEETDDEEENLTIELKHPSACKIICSLKSSYNCFLLIDEANYRFTKEQKPICKQNE